MYDMSQYKPIPEFPDYGVNEEGEVMNYRTHHRPAEHLNQYGCWYVSLYDRAAHKVRVRALGKVVASAFIEKPYPHWDSVIHLDFDQHNNHATNLDWRPRWFAVKYQKQSETPPLIINSIVCTSTGEVFPDSKAVATTFGILERELLEKIGEVRGVFPINHTFDWH